MNLSPKSYVFLTSSSKAGKPSSPYEVSRGRDWYGRMEIAPAACNAHTRLEAKREGWHTSVQRWAVTPSVKLVYRTYEESHRMLPLAWKSRVKKNSPLQASYTHASWGSACSARSQGSQISL